MNGSRIHQAEWMDDPKLPEEDYVEALQAMGRLNWFCGTARTIYRHLVRISDRQPNEPLRVIDVGSGLGDIPVSWAVKAKRQNVPLVVTTTDINSAAIEQQQCLAAKKDVTIYSLQRDCVRQGLPEGFDVATCSLLMHHLDEAQVARLLQSMQMAAPKGLIICDLDRSWLNRYLVWLGSRGLSRSKVIHHDADISIRSAFTRAEFTDLAEHALSRPVNSKAAFPARFIATVDEEAIALPSIAFA